LAAFCQWREASKLSEHVRKVYGQEKEPPWWHVLRTWFGKRQADSVTEKEQDSENIQYVESMRVHCILLIRISLNSDDDGTGKHRRHPWTRTHSFYALMGGFAIDTRSLELNIFGYNRRRMILSVDGFKFLLQHEPDILPDLSQTEIFDKSKASNLAKTVVCCQAIWFCAQCIARWYSDLAFSLLELNTFAHCACALIIFVLWWNKPMDVEGPTLITAETIRELVGLMTICSLPRNSRETQTSHPRLGLPRVQRPEGYWSRENELNLFEGQAYEGFEFLGHCVRHGPSRPQRLRIVRRGRTSDTETPVITLDENARICWTLARRGLAKYGIENIAGEGCQCLPFLDDCTKRMLVDRVGDIPRGESLSRRVILVTLALAGFLYGGIHLAAWQTRFKTKAEGQMWKISAITLAVSGPLGIPVVIFERVWRAPRRLNTERFMVCMVLTCMTPLFAAGLYIFARVYLIVESFLNLAYLEESTFVVPNWLQYMPHIT
jgi:hypothetical protein